MTSLKQAIADRKSRVEGWRTAARSSVSSRRKSIGDEALVAATGGGRTGPIDGGQSLRTAKAQYDAAHRDHPYAAIRPIAVSVADAACRVGRMSAAADMSSPVRTKEMRKAISLAPAFVKQISEGVEPLEKHRLYDILENPNPYMTQWMLKYVTAFSLEATGHALWWIDGEQIWYFPMSWARPLHETGRPFAAWKITPPGVAEVNGFVIPGEDACYFFYPDPGNPTMPRSPLQTQSRAVNTDEKIQQAQLAVMNNEGRPGLVLVAGDLPLPPGQTGTPRPPTFTAEQRAQLIEAVRLMYEGVNNWGEPLILDGLIKDARPFTSSPRDMDFQGGSMLTKDRIFEGIGTSPVVAGHTENANRAGSVVAHEVFYGIAVNPLITVISETMTKKLGPRFAGNGERLYIWFEKAVPNDPDTKRADMDLLAANGAITKNEMREAYDLPPRDDGDELIENNPPPSPIGPDGKPFKPGAAGAGGRPGSKPVGKPGQKPKPARGRGAAGQADAESKLFYYLGAKADSGDVEAADLLQDVG